MLSERDKEIQRLRGVVNAMFPDPLDTTYAMLRGMEGADVYFRRKDREPVANLLTADFKNAALLMYRFIGNATFDVDAEAGKIVQQVLMGALLHFFRTVCGYDDAAIKELRDSVPNFDPLKFSVFDNLGEI